MGRKEKKREREDFSENNKDEPLLRLISRHVCRILEEEMGIKSFFPVQSSIIPKLLDTIPKGDIAVCSPTGSGKTLCYAVPIVESLLSRVVPRLRALVIVPTRDLVLQSKDVFSTLCNGTDINVHAILGGGHDVFRKESLILSSGNVDILISTPGRLVDHLHGTSDFTVQHLRWLVIDEADRLIQQSYQEWLPKLISACHDRPTPSLSSSDTTVLSPNHLHTYHGNPTRRSFLNPPFQKLLFSATLTQNPSKLAPFNLINPSFYSSASKKWKFSMPEQISQSQVLCKDGEKPLVMLHLLLNLRYHSSLCFTASVESTHRLSTLLKQFDGIRVGEVTGNQTSSERAELVDLFQKKQLEMLICSDVMARGLDLGHGSAVERVINYDVPSTVKQYIHRCGRTGRAGRPGQAITLLYSNQISHFRNNIVKQIDDSLHIRKMDINPLDYAQLIPHYQDALDHLQTILQDEELHKSQPSLIKNY